MKRPPSISSRLFLYLFVSGLTALLIVGSGLYFEVGQLIAQNMDQALRSDIEIFTGLLKIEGDKIDLEHTQTAIEKFSIPHSGHYYQILFDGKIIDRSASLARVQLLLAPKQGVRLDAGKNQAIYDTTGPADEPLRAMVKSVPMAGHLVQILIAYSQAENLAILRSLRDFLLLFGVILILFMAILGRAIIYRSLQPLHDFSARVNRIGEETLDQRMEIDNQYLELGSLARAFNAMLERLQKSFEGREALLSDVSHELKTPVTVIRSYCDIYLQKERPVSEYIESLEVIRETAYNMGQKIHRLLGFAQTETDLIETAATLPVNLEDCLHKACVAIAPLAREREINISEYLSARLIIYGHAERLLEAFVNLLENAIKYNKPQGKVTISSERRFDQALIQIEDSGQGIPSEDIKHIFERFYRSPKTSRAEGSGLGLVLVKTIIEAHKGRIEVHSTLEEGTRFSIYLPLA